MRDEVGLTPLFMMIPINDDSDERKHNNNIYRFLPDIPQEKPLHTNRSNVVRGFSTCRESIMNLCSGLNSGCVKPKYTVKDLLHRLFLLVLRVFWEIQILLV